MMKNTVTDENNIVLVHCSSLLRMICTVIVIGVFHEPKPEHSTN